MTRIVAPGGVVALTADTGAILWHTYTVAPGRDGGAVWSTAAIDLANGVLFVGTGNAYHPPADPNTDSILKIRLRDGAIVQHVQATPSDAFSPGTPGQDVDFGGWAARAVSYRRVTAELLCFLDDADFRNRRRQQIAGGIFDRDGHRLESGSMP